MAGMTVAARGADQLARTAVAAASELGDLTEVHRAEGRATLAATVIPRDTGKLADSAAVVATDTGFSLTAAATYAGYVHADNPFFTRAINAREAAILAGIDDHVDDVLATIQGA